MKRWIALVLFLCMALALVPAMAEGEYYGDMEVVNCKTWVSLRETPSKSARRLQTVPLGAIVSHGQQHGDGWIYATYNGYEGYIQAQYLQACEGASMYSAMLVTNCLEGAELYASMDAREPDGFLPADALVRNCAVMANGWAYVEYGSQSGYVSAEYVAPYNELSHFPRQITLRRNLFGGAYEGPAPALKVEDAGAFPLAEYAYNEYDFTEYEPVDADTPTAHFVLYADETVNHVHLFGVSLSDMDENGEAEFDFVLEHIQYQVDPEHPLSVIAVIYGDMPNLAVGYADWTGAYHFAFLEISGEDGSLILREF